MWRNLNLVKYFETMWQLHKIVTSKYYLIAIMCFLDDTHNNIKLETYRRNITDEFGDYISNNFKQDIIHAMENGQKLCE